MAVTTLTSPFTVHIADENYNPEQTILQMGGGYVGAPTVDMPGYGGYGIQQVNAASLTILEQIGAWVSQNQIFAAGAGMMLLWMLARGRR